MNAELLHSTEKPEGVEAVRLGWDTWSTEVCDLFSSGGLTNGEPQGCYLDADGNGTDDFPGGDARIGLWIPTTHGLDLAREGEWLWRDAEPERVPPRLPETEEELADLPILDMDEFKRRAVPSDAEPEEVGAVLTGRPTGDGRDPGSGRDEPSGSDEPGTAPTVQGGPDCCEQHPFGPDPDCGACTVLRVTNGR